MKPAYLYQSRTPNPSGADCFLDLDNESLKPVNPGVIEHPLPNLPRIRLDRVPSMVSLVCISLSGVISQSPVPNSKHTLDSPLIIKSFLSEPHGDGPDHRQLPKHPGPIRHTDCL